VLPSAKITKSAGPQCSAGRRLRNMFKKDIPSAPRSKLKSSAQRGLRQSLLATYPLLAPHADEVLPRKGGLESVRLAGTGATLYVATSGSDGPPRPLFYQIGSDEPLLPHLRLVHRFPRCFPSVRVDRGAVRFVLGGATLMAPGLTSRGGRLPVDGGGGGDGDASDDDDDDEDEDGGGEVRGGEGGDGGGEEKHTEGLDADGRWSREIEKGEPVVITAEGKEEACAVGVLLMGTREVKEKGKGPVVEDAHYLGDGLWRLSID